MMWAKDKTSERDLILRAKNGDAVAFNQLVYRHDKHVLSIASRFAGNTEDVKDIYQEVFLKVYRGLGNFRFQSALSTWIHRITVNVCLSHNQRRQRSPFVPIEPGEREVSSAIEIHDKDARADGHLLNRELSDRISLALRTLPPKQRMVFTLRHHHGEQLKEIARAMKCTEGTVKRYLFDATRRMREQLEDLL
jgi:RNA polymerase sigma-70 factor (ECF subfamily)